MPRITRICSSCQSSGASQRAELNWHSRSGCVDNPPERLFPKHLLIAVANCPGHGANPRHPRHPRSGCCRAGVAPFRVFVVLVFGVLMFVVLVLVLSGVGRAWSLSLATQSPTKRRPARCLQTSSKAIQVGAPAWLDYCRYHDYPSIAGYFAACSMTAAAPARPAPCTTAPVATRCLTRVPALRSTPGTRSPERETHARDHHRHRDQRAATNGVGGVGGFPSYPLWNPFVRSIEGSPRAGETLKAFIQPVESRGMTFRPRVLRAVPDQELRWLGHLWLPGIFDGEHFFKIEPLDHGHRSRLIHGERFAGLLVPLLRNNLDRGTRAGFDAMNHALKARVEGAAR